MDQQVGGFIHAKEREVPQNLTDSLVSDAPLNLHSRRMGVIQQSTELDVRVCKNLFYAM